VQVQKERPTLMTNISLRPTNCNSSRVNSSEKTNSSRAASAAAIAPDDTFEDNLLFAQQDAISIYRNDFNQIVLRQRDPLGDDDNVIHVNVECAPRLIQRFEQLLVESNSTSGGQ
jgi:hypothetical protein